MDLQQLIRTKLPEDLREKAFKFQKLRGQKSTNANLNDSEIKTFCTLDESCQTILQKAITRYGLSQRSVNKTLKLSRTIADLELSQNIQKSHLLEAISLRV